MKILLAITISALAFSLSAQKQLSLYNLKGTPQALNVNPAFIPKARFHLSLPLGMMSFGLTNSGFAVNDLVSRRSDDSIVITPDKFISKLDKTNILSFENEINVFGFGFKLRDMYFNLSLNSKFQTNLVYPKGLFQLAIEGNGKNFIGERLSLDGIGFNLNAYTEYGVGFAKEIGEKLTVGGKFKLISGIANINTKKSTLGLYTDPETFALTVDGSAEINTSNSGIFLDTTLSSSELNQIGKDMALAPYNFKNKGVGIDLGATFKLTEKINLSASIIDLGMIRWSSNPFSYKSNDINFTFEGVNLNNYFSKDSVNNSAVENFGDTLNKIVTVNSNRDSYTTSLYTRIYLGGNYQLTKSINAGALLLNSFIKGKYNPALSLSVNFALRSWLFATVNYNIINKTYSNIGTGLSLRGGPMQFFIMSDNILGFIMPLKSRTFNLAFGMNILIKSKEKDEKIKKEKKNA